MSSTLADCVTFINGDRGKNYPKQVDFANGEVPFVSASDLSNNSLSNASTYQKKITKSAYEKLRSGKVVKEDILLCLRGSLGKLGVVSDDMTAAIASSLVILRPHNQTNSKFLFQWLKSPDFQQTLASFDNGSVQGNLSVKSISIIAVPDFSPNDQKAIAHILGALDDKIELNQKMNQTLEEIAKAIFKSWFVDFDPVRAKAEGRPTGLPPEISDLFPDKLVDSEIGEIPQGWRAVQLQEYVTVKRGGSPRPIHDFMSETGLPWVKISDASASDTRWIPFTKGFIKEEGLKKTVLLRKNELILSNSATPGIPRFLNLDACIHDGWLYFPEKQHFTDQYLYQLFLEIRPHLLNMGTGTVFTNLKTEILKQHETVLPSSELLAIFEERALLIHERCNLLLRETATLSELRDTLLPKLISGELRIPDAEKFLEEAGI